MMLRKLLGSVVFLLATVFVFLFFKTGAYKNVVIEVTSPPKLQLYYKEHIGPYHKIISTLEKVEKEFKNLSVNCPKTFGYFLDSPETKDHDKLKSLVGCAFHQDQSPQLFALPNGINENFFGADFDTETICYKGIFKGSPSLSAIKIYPKLKERMKKDKIKPQTAALEVYTSTGNSFSTEVYLCGAKPQS